MKYFTAIILLKLFSVGNALSVDEECIDPNTAAGKCVPVKSCPHIYKILRSDTISYEDNIFLLASKCGELDKKSLVCCKESDTDKFETQEKFGEPGDTESVPNLLPKPGSCGVDNTNYTAISGTETNIRQYPWLVRLQYYKLGDEYGFHCGGALINDLYVLTAAHCIEDVPITWVLYKIRLGEWDSESENDCDENKICSDSVEDVPISSYLTHKDYKQKNDMFFNDIALIRMARKVNFTDFIQPICLPMSNIGLNKLIGIKMYISGWAQTMDSTGDRFKHAVDVYGVGNKECTEKYAEDNTIINEDQICAEVKSNNTCIGDLGGPLMSLIKFKGRSELYWFLTGVASFGFDRCDSDIPGVYSRVSSHMQWIESNIYQENLDYDV